MNWNKYNSSFVWFTISDIKVFFNHFVLFVMYYIRINLLEIHPSNLFIYNNINQSILSTLFLLWCYLIWSYIRKIQLMLFIHMIWNIFSLLFNFSTLMNYKKTIQLCNYVNILQMKGLLSHYTLNKGLTSICCYKKIVWKLKITFSSNSVIFRRTKS